MSKTAVVGNSVLAPRRVADLAVAPTVAQRGISSHCVCWQLKPHVFLFLYIGKKLIGLGPLRRGLRDLETQILSATFLRSYPLLTSLSNPRDSCTEVLEVLT